MNNNKQQEEQLFDTEAQEGVDYIKPTSIETQLSKEKREECRFIVKQLNDFGFGQRQLLFLIELLALQLEDRQTMLAVKQVVAENRNKVPVSKIILEK